jgi:hypothetical protein
MAYWTNRILSELMIHPSSVSASNGTWIELYNTGSSTVDMSDFVLQMIDQSSNSLLNKIIPSANVSGKGYYVVGTNIDSTTNGNVTVNWRYGSQVLNASGGGVFLNQLSKNGLVLYVRWGTTDPALSIPTGVSLMYTKYSVHTTVDDQGLASNWCRSAAVPYNGVDFGTPGKDGLCATNTRAPTKSPTRSPTKSPTRIPNKSPTRTPTNRPTRAPTKVPTKTPAKSPTRAPTNGPTKAPAKSPTKNPTKVPTAAPSKKPTAAAPIDKPTAVPTKSQRLPRPCRRWQRRPRPPP